jgi:4-hydroxy-3-polyprenylbenzoate decarboxylase
LVRQSTSSDAELRWTIGITGASGTVYARRLLQVLVRHVDGIHLDVVVSEAALRVMRDEEDLAAGPGRLTAENLLGFPCDAVDLYSDRPNGSLTLHNPRDIGASIASGSYRTRGMAIVPCSMKTLAAVAHGFGANLISRAADVVLKEGRPLVLVPRETPFSAIHLQNMLRLARLGVAIVPAMPGFYNRPRSIADLVDHMVMRILDQMGFAIDLAPRWPEVRDQRDVPQSNR